MRIATVAPFPAGNSAPSGGVSAVAQSLVGHFVANGHCCHVIAVNGARSTTESHSDLLHVHSLSKGALPGVLDFWLRMPDRIVAVLRKIQPDIVHVHGPAIWADAALAVAPSVLTIHGVPEREIAIRHRHLGVLVGPLLRALDERCVRRLPCVIRINPYVNELRELSSVQMVVDIPNPIDGVFFSRPVASGSPVRTRGRLVWVGNVGPRKRLDRAIEFVAAAKQRGEIVGLDVFGVSGTEKSGFMSHCRRLMAASGLEDHVLLHGHQPRARLIEALDCASALLVTSSQETAPCAISEALARGAFVVAPKEFGIPYMLADPKLGYLYESDDAPADVIGAALEAARMFSRFTNERSIAAEQYRLESVGRETLRVYEQILAT